MFINTRSSLTIVTKWEVQVEKKVACLGAVQRIVLVNFFFSSFYEVCILVESESALGYARDIKGYVVLIGYTVRSPAI